MRRIPSGSESPSLIALSRSRLIFREGIVDYSFSFFLLPTIDPDLGIRSRGIGTRFHSLCVSADIALRKRWRGRSGICDSLVFRLLFLSLSIWISIRISIWLNGDGRSRWISHGGCIGQVVSGHHTRKLYTFKERISRKVSPDIPTDRRGHTRISQQCT
jgi:hypothetical protein